MWSSAALLIALGGTTAFAGPNEALIYRACRDTEASVFWGAPNRDSLTLARCVDWTETPSDLDIVKKDLHFEVSALDSPDTLVWRTNVHGRLGLGPMGSGLGRT